MMQGNCTTHPPTYTTSINRLPGPGISIIAFVSRLPGCQDHLLLRSLEILAVSSVWPYTQSFRNCSQMHQACYPRLRAETLSTRFECRFDSRWKCRSDCQFWDPRARRPAVCLILAYHSRQESAWHHPLGLSIRKPHLETHYNLPKRSK